MLVYGKCECFFVQMLYVCVLCASCDSSKCCILHDLQFVNTGCGCKRRRYGSSKRHGIDKLNIRHLTHIGPLGLAFLTSMLKTALNTNIIPHIWKLVNIVPIPKTNKDIDKGTSYRPIFILSVIAKTLEKSLNPYITANIPNTPTQHGYKAQHSTVTALHTVNNTIAKRFN